MANVRIDDFLDNEQEASAESSQGPTLRITREVDVEAAVRRLPPLPAILQELLQVLRDVDADIGRIQKRISGDPSLTTRVLKMANSPFYNSRQEVVSVSRAVMILGFKTVSNLIMASGFRGAMSVSRPIPGFQSNGIFRHSLGVGVCANRLAQVLPALRDCRDEVFVAGLLHDVGRIALSSFYKERAHDIKLSPGRGLDKQIEREVLGIDHEAVGEKVLDHWGLPANLMVPVTRHHDDPKNLQDEPVAQVVALTDTLLNLRGYALERAHGDEQRLVSLADMLETDRETVDDKIEGFEDEVSSIMGAE